MQPITCPFFDFEDCGYWDHEISIIVTSILTILTVFRRKLDLGSLLIMEIRAIHSWKSQYISVWFLVIIYCVILLEMLNFNKYRSAVATLVDPIQPRNISGGFSILFFHLFFILMCNLFSTYFSVLTHFFSSIDIFNS
jgi:hypothetical protein